MQLRRAKKGKEDTTRTRGIEGNNWLGEIFSNAFSLMYESTNDKSDGTWHTRDGGVSLGEEERIPYNIINYLICNEQIGVKGWIEMTVNQWPRVRGSHGCIWGVC